MHNHDSQKKNISHLLMAADVNSKENPLQTAIQFLKLVRKRWIIVSASFALVVAIFLVRHFTAKESYYASAELIAISEQYTSSDILNHPLLKLGQELIVSDEIMDVAAEQLTIRENGKEVKPEDKVEFLRENFGVTSTRSKPHVIQLTFYDHDEEQARKCLDAIIASYQQFAEKSMEEWKEKKLKEQQERIKFYEESDREVAFGSKLIEQAEAMSMSLQNIKGEFDSDNPHHREQLSLSLQEQIYGIRPDLKDTESGHDQPVDNQSPENVPPENNKTETGTNNVENNPGANENAPISPVIAQDETKKPATIPGTETENPATTGPEKPNLIASGGINPVSNKKKLDAFEKELAQLQLLLYQSRILNQLRSTVVRIEQKARSRENLAAELEIPIHVNINKKTETKLIGEGSSSKRMLLVVCFLATGLGVGLIFVMDQFDDHFRSPVEAEKNSGQASHGNYSIT